MAFFDSPAPILQRGRGKAQLLSAQVADHIKIAINEGQLGVGEKLPTTDQLVTYFDANRATIRKAIGILKDQNLIYSRATKGVYVGSEADSHTSAKQEYRTIGLASRVIYPGHTGPFHLSLINQLTHQLTMRNQALNLLPFINMDINTMDSCLNMMRWVDGIIYLGSFPKPFLRRLINEGPPSVLVDTGYPMTKASSIQLDNKGGAYAAIEHLYELGHYHIGVVTGFKGDSTTEERMIGIDMAKETFSGLSIHCEEGQFQRESGIQATDHLLKQHPQITAIFYFNDEMAMASMSYLQHQRGMKIPSDLSIIGFDNIEWSDSVHPGLTTVQVSTQTIAKSAGAALDSLFSNASKTPFPPTVIPATLIERASTAPL